MVSFSSVFSRGRLRTKGSVDNAALDPALTGEWAGTVKSWLIETLFFGALRGVDNSCVLRKGNGYVEVVRVSRVYSEVLGTEWMASYLVLAREDEIEPEKYARDLAADVVWEICKVEVRARKEYPDFSDM